MLSRFNRYFYSGLIVLIVLAPPARAADQNDESIALTDEQKMEQVREYFKSPYQEEDYFRTDRLLLQVVTASKRSQKIAEAPSPIYAFTAEDIQRTGVRNIMELLTFIPGWYVYPKIDQTFVIATRGIRSSNDKILFLIDGIPLNNSAQGGAVNMQLFPGLDMIKRVEVISGPGSTMWGSDAALGIISIIEVVEFSWTLS